MWVNCATDLLRNKWVCSFITFFSLHTAGYRQNKPATVIMQNLCFTSYKRAQEIKWKLCARNPDHDNIEQRILCVHRWQSEFAGSAGIVHHIQSQRTHTRAASNTFFASVLFILVCRLGYFHFLWVYFVFIVSECSIVGWYFPAACLVNGPAIDATHTTFYMDRLVESVQIHMIIILYTTYTINWNYWYLRVCTGRKKE